MAHKTIHLGRLKYEGTPTEVQTAFDEIDASLGMMTSGNFLVYDMTGMSGFHRGSLRTLLGNHGFRTGVTGNNLTIAW